MQPEMNQAKSSKANDKTKNSKASKLVAKKIKSSSPTLS
jgi:hypothetical protein